MLPLFWIYFTLIEHTYNIFIYTTRREPLLISSLLPLGRGPPLGCRAENQTRACLNFTNLGELFIRLIIAQLSSTVSTVQWVFK